MSENDFFEKELSWLSFNERVLQEAQNPDVPLIQRVRYLGISSNNMDEFFRVRVADVSRLAEFSRDSERKEKYKVLLGLIQRNTKKHQKNYNQTYSEVLAELRKRKIYLINEKQLDQSQRRKVSEIFEQHVLPELDPVLIDNNAPFPEIADGSIYLAIKLTDVNNSIRYCILQIPTDRLPRFIEIPQIKGKRGKVFIVLENVIRLDLKSIFRGVFDIKNIEAYEFKVTRDADLELGEDIDESLIDRMAQSLKKRQHADPERFLYDAHMPLDLLKLLYRGLGLSKYDSEMPGAAYHNAKDFINFPNIGPAYLHFKPQPVLPVPELTENSGNIFQKIRESDILLYYPYNSFSVIIDLLKSAAIDPSVKTINICLYRTASKSRIVDALISAKNNGKNVNAVVELQARFDEEANISWARELTDAGVNVSFGVAGLKVHSKILLISRQEGKNLKHYSHVGTGNFNEKTAAIYTDFSLLTFDQAIGNDVAKVFDFINYTYKHHKFEKILVSPLSNKSGLLALIERERDHAAKGLPAEINIKCNNLVDRDIMPALYEASNAGVRIRIICRSMFSMVTGQPGQSENIEAISIVDRFLEHSRVYIFHNAGNRQYFISSADLMTRNLDYRVEVSAPIRNDNHKKRIQDIFDIQWCDNVKSRQLDAKQKNTYTKRPGGEKVRSQDAIYKYLKSGKLPHAVVRARKRWLKELEKAKKKSKKS